MTHSATRQAYRQHPKMTSLTATNLAFLTGRTSSSQPFNFQPSEARSTRKAAELDDFRVRAQKGTTVVIDLAPGLVIGPVGSFRFGMFGGSKGSQGSGV